MGSRPRASFCRARRSIGASRGGKVEGATGAAAGVLRGCAAGCGSPCFAESGARARRIGVTERATFPHMRCSSSDKRRRGRGRSLLICATACARVAPAVLVATWWRVLARRHSPAWLGPSRSRPAAASAAASQRRPPPGRAHAASATRTCLDYEDDLQPCRLHRRLRSRCRPVPDRRWPSRCPARSSSGGTRCCAVRSLGKPAWMKNGVP